MDLRLTADEARAYLEQGFFVRPAALDATALAELREAVEQVHVRVEQAATHDVPVEQIDGRRYQDVLGSKIKWEWREDSREIRSMEPVRQLSPRVDALIDDPRLVSPVSDLLGGGEISLFTDKLNFKRPGGSPFPWHQDAPYWAFGCKHLDELASLQLYLDDADQENGCLWMIPGSHRNGMLPGYPDRGVLGRLYTDMDRYDGEGVPIEAPAGSVIFFDGYVVHGSRGNRSASSRRALVITYQSGVRPLWGSSEARAVRVA